MCFRRGAGGHYYLPQFSIRANLCLCLQRQRGDSEDFRLGTDIGDQLCQLFHFAMRKGRTREGSDRVTVTPNC